MFLLRVARRHARILSCVALRTVSDWNLARLLD